MFHLVNHRETNNDRLPLLFRKSRDGIQYDLLFFFKKDDVLLSFDSGSTMSIKTDENGDPILYEDNETAYYITSDGTRLDVSKPFGPLLGKVDQYYLKYCVPSVVESFPSN